MSLYMSGGLLILLLNNFDLLDFYSKQLYLEGKTRRKTCIVLFLYQLLPPARTRLAGYGLGVLIRLPKTKSPITCIPLLRWQNTVITATGTVCAALHIPLTYCWLTWKLRQQN